MDSGGPLPILTISYEGELILNTENLEAVLLPELVTDSPVTVISVTGSHDNTKQSLLHLLIRAVSGQTNGRHLIDEDLDKALGSDGPQEAAGIFLWSKAFVGEDEKHTKQTLLIMDARLSANNESQGTDSLVLALSSLLSSLQIRVLPGDIDLHSVESLHLLADHTCDDDKNKPKSLQSLHLLAQGNGNTSGIQDGSKDDIKDISSVLKQMQLSSSHDEGHIQQLLNGFDSVNCSFLNLQESEDDKDDVAEVLFSKCIQGIMNAFLSSGNTVKRHISIKQITGRELLQIFKGYAKALQENKRPSSNDLLKASQEILYSLALDRIYKSYVVTMQKVYKANHLSANELDEFHRCKLAEALKVLDDAVKDWSSSHHNEAKERLTKDIGRAYDYIAKENTIHLLKLQVAAQFKNIGALHLALTTYEDLMNEEICTSTSIEKKEKHTASLNKALAKYDEACDAVCHVSRQYCRDLMIGVISKLHVHASREEQSCSELKNGDASTVKTSSPLGKSNVTVQPPVTALAAAPPALCVAHTVGLQHVPFHTRHVIPPAGPTVAPQIVQVTRQMPAMNSLNEFLLTAGTVYGYNPQVLTGTRIPQHMVNPYLTQTPKTKEAFVGFFEPHIRVMYPSLASELCKILLDMDIADLNKMWLSYDVFRARISEAVRAIQVCNEGKAQSKECTTGALPLNQPKQSSHQVGVGNIKDINEQTANFHQQNSSTYNSGSTGLQLPSTKKGIISLFEPHIRASNPTRASAICQALLEMEFADLSQMFFSHEYFKLKIGQLAKAFGQDVKEDKELLNCIEEGGTYDDHYTETPDFKRALQAIDQLNELVKERGRIEDTQPTALNI